MPSMPETNNRRRNRERLRRLMFDPITFIAAAGIYVSFAMFMVPTKILDLFLTPTNIGITVGALSFLIFVSKYLGIFTEDSDRINLHGQPTDSVDPSLLREIRNYLAHTPQPSADSTAQINIDEAFKGQLLARLTTESQGALASFVESEVFKAASETRFKESERSLIVRDVGQMISTYQLEMGSWRKNANVNLLIGLMCAIAGIGVMWQTLVTLNFELDAGASWKITDLYRFIARFGLVLIIESVAFFFLKLYREDRSMIRYLRNEITNLESKCLALKAALSFGSGPDITKVLQSLSATERNFLVKKGERVMSDITYENSEILLEKLITRYPDLLSKLTKPAG